MEAGRKYVEVKRVLKARIGSEYAVGTKIPSTIELHKSLGVSPGTVDRAIRDLVAEGLLERFKSRGTFVAGGKTRNIGLLWPSFVMDVPGNDYVYPAHMLHVIERAAQEHDTHVLVRSIREWDRPEFLGGGNPKVMGMIIMFNCGQGLVDAYHEAGIPVVLVDPLLRMPGAPFVTADHFSASHEATRHLIGLGHRRIAHVTIKFPTFSMPMEERFLGYKEAMASAGLEDGRGAHFVQMPIHAQRPAAGETIPASETEAVAAFLAMLKEREATACCCWDDFVAAWVIRICHEAGIRVPEDLSVVGINDMDIAAHTWPPLTTVRLPMREIGCTAVEILDKLMEGGRCTGGGHVLPVQLIERASTAAPASASAVAAARR